jgi:hypothetical protein
MNLHSYFMDFVNIHDEQKIIISQMIIAFYYLLVIILLITLISLTHTVWFCDMKPR